MRCPECDADSDRVVDSRPADEAKAIRRRRECQGCRARFTTFERVETAPVMVVKRDGRLEPYSADKLRASIGKAAIDREALVAAVEELALAIELEVMLRHGSEIPTRVLGAEVLERLKARDDVAYLRYASVHRNFDSGADFRRELDQLDLDRKS